MFPGMTIPNKGSWHQDPDIGIVPDVVIASRYGLTRAAIGEWRKRNGIPTPERLIIRRPWQEDPELGKVPDAVLGARYGVGKQTVYDYRKKHGIKIGDTRGAQQRVLQAQDRREVVALALVEDAQQSNRALSRALQVAPETVAEVRAGLGVGGYARQAQFSDEIHELAGQGLPVQQIASGLGISYHRVYNVLKQSGKLNLTKVDWGAEQLLGKVPDGVLAEKYGVNHTSVAQARKLRGIASFRSGGKK